MKTRRIALLLGVVCSLCWHCRKADVAPVDQLPPATQEGRNTVGFLFNGQAWLPAGSDGNRGSHFSVVYEGPYQADGTGGSLDLRMFRYTKDTDQYANLYVRRLKLGVNSFTDTLDTNAWLDDGKTGCNYNTHRYNQQQPRYRSGNLTITRLDLTRGIIAGTFEFTIVIPGCDTLRVTQGRFDKWI